MLKGTPESLVFITLLDHITWVGFSASIGSIKHLCSVINVMSETFKCLNHLVSKSHCILVLRCLIVLYTLLPEGVP